MATPAERLIQARKAAGYDDAASAARAMAITQSTYLGHENGSRGLSRSAPRYARFFRVSLDWLLNGRGEMHGRSTPLKLVGEVGAGAIVIPFERPTEEVHMPEAAELRVLRVRGDSQYPRYLDGELVMVETQKRDPRDVIGRYCLCITEDGRWLLKILRRGETPRTWRLESHNAPPEEDVRLDSVYAVRGTIDL
jgi:hypothetical protein